MNKPASDDIIQELKFRGAFDAIVCLDADLPEPEFYEKFPEAEILAADGAGGKLLATGVEPDFVIGDMDSFDFRSFPIAPEKIVEIPDQETNDFEKVLKFAERRGRRNILAVGFHGGRLEHTFNNWSIFKKYSRNLNLCVYDKGRYGFVLRGAARIPARPDEIVSIIPQTRAKVTTRNLQWELNGEILELGVREGARNRALGESFEICAEGGEVLVFVDSRIPFAPEIR